MSRRRRSHSKNARRGFKWSKTILASVMLALLMVVIIPLAKRQSIPVATSLALVLGLWACGLLAASACTKKRHRSYSHGWQQAYPTRMVREEPKAEVTSDPAGKPVN